MAELGDQVKDRVTGLKGIAVAVTTWISGCNRITIQPPVDKDGKPPENYTVDEDMIEVIKKNKLGKVKKKKKKELGGPLPMKITQE